MLKSIFTSSDKAAGDKRLGKFIKNVSGLTPKNISLYKQAFRHISVAKEIKNGVRNSNERLEYLGDAVLGAIVAEYLFVIYPFREEGFLTQMRSRIVNRVQLNQLAKKLGFDELLEADLRGTNAHSILGDAFEAFIGALYLDLGFERTKKFVITRIIKIHLDLDSIEQNNTDFKSRLINYCQREKKKLLFNLAKEVGSGNKKEFLIEIIINGKCRSQFQHSSKRKAEQYAAELVVRDIESKGKEI